MSKLLSIVCLLFISHSVFSQLSIGLKASSNSAWQNYGEFTPPDGAEIEISGYSIAAMLYSQLGERIRVGIEPGFTERGAACVPGWQPIFEGDTKFYLDYIKAPIYIGYQLPLFSKFSLDSKMGYGPSYLISAIREEVEEGEDVGNKITMPLENGNTLFRRIDHGVYMNLGLSYKLDNLEFLIEAGYYHGFADAEIFNVSKNRSLSGSLGILKRLSCNKSKCTKTKKLSES